MKKIVIFSLLLILTGTSTIYAQDASGQSKQLYLTTDANIVSYSSNAITVLEQIYRNALAGLYNKLIETYADIAYEFDMQLPAAVEHNKQLAAGEESAKQAMLTSTQEAINESFAGIGVSRDKELKMIKQPAGDDLIDPAAIKNESIFGSNITNLPADEKAALEGNAMFDASSLLGTDNYTEKQQQAAEQFMQQITGSSDISSKIIHIAPKFYVPVINPQEPEQTSLLIGSDKPLSTSEIKKMREILFTKPEYRDYRVKYRGAVAQRSIYLNNLLRSYQLRMPVQNGKSVLELRNERIKRRLQQKYYADMAQASPTTVARETLFVLADISDELNDIRNQNERMLAMSSVSGLNQLAIGSQLLDMQAKKIGKLIACMTPEYEKSSLCTAKEPIEEIEKLDIAKMQEELTEQE